MSITRKTQMAVSYTPPVGGGGGQTTITHGEQVTTSNTGYVGYYDTSLGRNLQLSDLQVISGVHYISDYLSTGGSISKKHFTGSIIVDIDNVTFIGCFFDNTVSNYLNGRHAKGTNFNYCTISPSSVQDVGIYFQGYSALRCYIRGSSDGLRINGGATTQEIVECYLRVKMATNADHNDTLQNVGGTGIVNIRRCNLSVVPEGGIISGGDGGPNGVLQSADMANNANFSLTLEDSLIEGKNSEYSLRLYDGGISTNIRYRITGNKHLRPGANSAEVHRGVSNITPTSQITWSNNTWADNGAVISLS